ncbi:MAG: hypothetical protein ABEI32_03840 [Halothece sp.]
MQQLKASQKGLIGKDNLSLQENHVVTKLDLKQAKFEKETLSKSISRVL